MLTEEDKKKLDAVFEAAKKGDLMAYLACLFMTEEQKDYMQALCNDCQRNP